MIFGIAFFCCHQDRPFEDIEANIVNRNYALAESKLHNQLIQDSIQGDHDAIATSLMLYSKLRFSQFNYTEALQYIDKSLDIASKSSHSPTNIKALVLKGDIYYELKDIEKCIATFDSVLTHAQSQKDKTNIAYAWNRLAICNLRLRNDSIALLYNNKSDSIA
ncbi:MAG TPA: hypothetical protein PK622_08075, partial [Saprospiraceae bacterium]|nr:hypothetical protein [Saprospiraceae bacterium]